MNTQTIAIATAKQFRINAGHCYDALLIVENDLALPTLNIAMQAANTVYEVLTSERAKAGYRLCWYVGSEVAIILRMIAIACYTTGQNFRAWCDAYVESCLEPVADVVEVVTEEVAAPVVQVTEAIGLPKESVNPVEEFQGEDLGGLPKVKKQGGRKKVRSVEAASSFQCLA